MNGKPVIDIIDDDEAMRHSVAFLLDVQGFESRQHESANAFLSSAGGRGADCIITDVRMPDMTGLELVRKLKSEGVASPVIVMTGHGDIGLAVEAMKAGVIDFIEKPFANETLISAVQEALRRGHDRHDARPDAERRLETLSPRERDVLAGVVAGKVNKVIAHELEISPRTVEIYRANLMVKTGARNFSELMRIALAAGL
ncbi:response regulator FixJ [Phenylobacterium sp. LjRoot164]|uniref:response regulator FixJ n=1 Tax=unclassified Phenylobacterium TaxID=2640670 RepID=UPI003ECC724E